MDDSNKNLDMNDGDNISNEKRFVYFRVVRMNVEFLEWLMLLLLLNCGNIITGM